MTDTLYLADISPDSPLITDLNVKFTEFELTQSGAAIQASGSPPLRTVAYDVQHLQGVNKGDYETVVFMCDDDSDLPRRLVSDLKGDPILVYYRIDDMPKYAHSVCGAFRLSSILRLNAFPNSNWQIILSQASKTRPVRRYYNK